MCDFCNGTPVKQQKIFDQTTTHSCMSKRIFCLFVTWLLRQLLACDDKLTSLNIALALQVRIHGYSYANFTELTRLKQALGR